MTRVISNHKECPKCGDDHKGKPFCIYENGFHCFSCGYSHKGDRSFTRAVPVFRSANLPDINYNPSTFTVEAYRWLVQYYMTDDTIRCNNIGQAKDGSIVMPFVVDGVVVCWQQRWLGEERRFMTGGTKTPAMSSVHSDTVVIVEDFISFCRVSQITDCVCLFGTNLPDSTAQYLFNKYSNILVWLDNDTTKETNSGQKAAKKICKKFQSILAYKQRQFSFGGVDYPVVTNIATDQDPKCYSPTQLRSLLCVESRAI